MVYNSFGKTDLKVSDVGFGAWAIGGLGWGAKPDDENAVAALKKAWDSGVNFYDTCDAYGNGHSEELMGTFFKGMRQQAIIVTKGGTNYRVPERSKNFTHDYLMMCLDESLQRLQTDYVDVYLLHVPSAQWQDQEKVFETLKEMKASGKTRYVGLAMWGAQDTLHAFETDTERVIDVLECPFNILNKSNLEVVKIAKERQIGVLTSEPLAGGILTGKYGSDTVFPDDDHRKGFWTAERFESIREDMKVIEACMQETGMTMAQLALAYNLSYPGIESVIPGGKNAMQVEGNVSASGMRLSSEMVDRLTATKGFVY